MSHNVCQGFYFFFIFIGPLVYIMVSGFVYLWDFFVYEFCVSASLHFLSFFWAFFSVCFVLFYFVCFIIIIAIVVDIIWFFKIGFVLYSLGFPRTSSVD